VLALGNRSSPRSTASMTTSTSSRNGSSTVTFESTYALSR
jgi:hypothetical protein